MEAIKKGEEIFGMVLRDIKAGSTPLTAGNEPLQIVTLKHPAGTHLKAHTHESKKRETYSLQECAMVKKGKVRIGIFDTEGKMFTTLELGPGELYLSMKGGISIDILEDAEVIEFKNGPFVEDKVLLE